MGGEGPGARWGWGPNAPIESMRILTASQMREADRLTIHECGVPSATLMERAGQAVVAAIGARWPPDTLRTQAAVLVICGAGNNGGDGFVIARLLHAQGVPCRILLMGHFERLTGDALTMHARATAAGVATDEIEDELGWARARPFLDHAELVVDALFGTGVRVPLAGLAATIVADVNTRATRVVAVDLPSGLSADTAEVGGPAVRADLTVTFAAPKWPLVLPPAHGLAGEVVIADIGIPRGVVDSLPGRHVEMLTMAEARQLMPPRAPDSHKGTYGRVLVVAGSVGKTGAAFLSAMSALRSGAGLVTVATPASCLPTVAAMGAEYMTMALDEAGDGLALRAADQILGEQADVIALGPGLGRSPETGAVVRAVIAQARVPLVIDADGLWALRPGASPLRWPQGVPVVITPHPGEMASLVGRSTADVQADRMGVATTYAEAQQVFVVLKGHRTLVAAPDARLAINTTGNPGMATAGAGDVLTGVIAAWLAQSGDAFTAARLGTFLHGLAGNLAADREGEVGLVAGDILAHLGRAALTVSGPTVRPGISTR